MVKMRIVRTSGVLGSAATALLLVALALAACGESRQDKARAQVCDARKAISEQVTKLQGMTISSSNVEEAKSGLESIGGELSKIRDAQSDLAPGRKEAVEAATSKFGQELKALGVQVALSLTSGTTEAAIQTAKPKVETAIEALANDYRQALGPISC